MFDVCDIDHDGAVVLSTDSTAFYQCRIEGYLVYPGCDVDGDGIWYPATDVTAYNENCSL